MIDKVKTLWQIKKLLKTSNFSFCHHVFNSIQLFHFHLKGVSKNIWVCFQNHLLQICCIWERVKHYTSKEEPHYLMHLLLDTFSTNNYSAAGRFDNVYGERNKIN